MKKPFWKKEKSGSVTSPLGFNANGLHAGIKKKKKRYDVSLIYSKAPCVAAGTFTTNRAKAWPVLYSIKAIESLRHHAILGTSGNANCLNGPIGKRAVDELVWETAQCLEILPQEVLIAQTGIIGVPFPISRVKRSIPKLVSKLSVNGGHGAAKGILTTDLRDKEIALSFDLGGKKVTVAACAKGAGMVHPNMATMLCFITTDCAITKPMLRRAVRHAADDTFNKMAIDNDMSTNDMVLCLANGLAGNHTITKTGRDYWMFRDVLEEVMRYIAYEMVRDGEGVTHVCKLRLTGAKTPTDAEQAARQIANSMLFKTMLAGSNPNWGRIAAAVGASGVDFNFKDMSISFGDAEVVHQGKLRVLNIPKARKILQKKEYTIDVKIGKGRGRAEFVTSDLTTKYVLINADYS